MTENFEKILSAEAEKLGIGLSEEKKEKLYRYYEMVVEKNKVMNLTAITEEKDFVIKHIIDSLAIVKAGEKVVSLFSASDIKVIDVGTGAGMPGIILKIFYPSAELVLFDSLKKRLNFLDEAISELGLSGVSTLHGRAEDLGRNKEYRESFDVAVSRAVANMATLSEYCLPLVKKGGLFIPYKSGDIDEELKEGERAIKLLGGKLLRTEKYDLPDTDMKRSLIIIEKASKTPKEYPRKAGTPSKEPLR